MGQSDKREGRIIGKQGKKGGRKKAGGRRRDLTMEVDGINVYKGKK